jgi:hypothetical protein
VTVAVASRYRASTMKDGIVQLNASNRCKISDPKREWNAVVFGREAIASAVTSAETKRQVRSGFVELSLRSRF